MPRPSKGARLERRDNGVYHIRDGTRRISTRTRDSRKAESALAAYITRRDRPGGPSTPDTMTVNAALSIYGRERAPTVKAPERIAYAIEALSPILGALPVGSINGAVCRRYTRTRNKADGTVRKELGVLQAAVNFCYREGYLTAPIKVTLPAKPAPRDRWLTRDEVAALLRAARRNPKTRHLCRFILTGVYSGSRREVILNLRFMPHVAGGWVDTENGVLYRRAPGEAETAKRTPPAPIPPRLLAHMRRWERMGARHVVELRGQLVGSIKNAWKSTLAAAGIDHARPHDLRHTCATWLLQGGAEMWQAAGYLGMGVDVLERTYGHHSPRYMQGAVQALSRRPGA